MRVMEVIEEPFWLTVPTELLVQRPTIVQSGLEQVHAHQVRSNHGTGDSEKWCWCSISDFFLLISGMCVFKGSANIRELLR